jgi:transposase InsO family protein
MVKKKDGTWRLCVDFREINKKLQHDPFPLPKIDQMIDQFGGAQFLSTGDLFWGFYHVKIRDEDTHKLAFSTDTSRFEFVHMPMGLKIAPAVFQRLMNLTLDDYLRKFVLVYMDDLIIYSETKKEHFNHLTQVFDRMRDAGLRLKIEKCSFFQKELKFLGVIISKEGIRLDPDKVAVVRNFPKPDKDLGQLQSFLGMVGYFKRHIPGYAKIARPLFDLLRGEDTHKKKKGGTVHTPYKHHEWGPEQDAAFEKLKELATTAPVLQYPDFERPFILTTDASAYALGYVLSQEFDDGEHPIAYGSRSLKGSEVNYSNTDREMFAIVKGIEHFRPYLYGRPFLVRTDHQAIKFIHNGKSTSSRVLKWALEMADYEFEVIHTPATRIRHADALSRIRHPDETVNIPEEQVFSLWGKEGIQWEPTVTIHSWANEQKNDPSLARYFQTALGRRDPRFRINNEILYQKINDTFVPVAPSNVRYELLKQFHNPPLQGHVGPERTYEKMRKQVFWPGMRRDVYNFIQRCFICQKYNRSYLRTPLQRQIIPPTAFHTVSMDIVGPVPPSPFGDRYILVIQDVLTRWVEFAAMKQADTTTIVNAFMATWITRYGVPQQVLTDRGSNFLSELAQAFYRAFGIKKVNTTAYRPQGNGANERSHGAMKAFFSKYLHSLSKSKWRFLLNDARYAYNTAFHGALGMSPYEALFALTPSLGILGIPYEEKKYPDSFEEYYNMHRRDLISRRKLIQESLDKSQENAITLRNRHSHKIPFEKGDWVLLKNHVPKTKWDEKYRGPWQIADVLSPVIFDIDIDGQRRAVHAAHLKPFKTPANSNLQEIDGPDQPTQAPLVTPNEENDDDNYWLPSTSTRLDPNQSLSETINASVQLNRDQDADYHSDDELLLNNSDGDEDVASSSDSSEEAETETTVRAGIDRSPLSSPVRTSTPYPNVNERSNTRSSPIARIRRLVKNTARRALEFPPTALSARPKRDVNPPRRYSDSEYPPTRRRQ